MFPRVSYPGISFNDNPYFMLDGVPGLSGGSIRRESFDMPLADYGVYVSTYYGQRAFALEGMIIATTIQEFVDKRDQLSAAFTPFNGEQPLVFEYDSRPTRQIKAVVSDKPDFDPTPDSPFACAFHIPMMASFPFLTGASDTTISLSLSVTGGGTVPATVPMSLSMNSGGSAFFTNTGSAPSYSTAHIPGPVVNPSLRNITTGQDMLFNLTLLAGQYLNIDFRAHRVSDDTGRSRGGQFRGKWWKVGTGVTEVRFVADSNDPSVSAQITLPITYLNA
jgi:hypothetical protein